LLISGIALAILSGCANINQPAAKSNPALPTVKEFKAYPDRNAMALYWEPVDGMSGYYIQKYNSKTKKWETIKQINDTYKSIYVDTGLKPNTPYKYRIAAFNKNGVPSLAKETMNKTLPTISPVIPLETRSISKGVVKIVFRPHQNERVNRYLLQKFDDENSRWVDIAELKPRLNVEYIDTGLKDGRIYKYRIFAYSYDGLVSAPSKTIVVSTYPKPPLVMNVQASVDLPKKIKITFSPVKGAVYYKIYRSDSPDSGFELYAKTKNTEFIDNVKEDGVKKYYKVTAVTAHNTESLFKNTPVVMGESLKKPAKPAVSVNVYPNNIEFTFTSPDKRAYKYLVIREERISPFKKESKKFIVNGSTFKDTINPKKDYVYYIYEVDKYGIISSQPAKVEVGD